MAATTDDFTAWLEQADISPQRLTPEVRVLLQAVFRFRQEKGFDYYSTRLLSHFLLHCDTGLKVAEIARLLGIARPTASRQQGMSSKEAIGQAHHRMDGRPHGKLLPRYAGPILAFLLGHPDASRAELLDFIERTFAVRVSRIALYKFLKKYGLDDISAAASAPAAPADTTPPPEELAAAEAIPLNSPSPPSIAPTPPSASAPPVGLALPAPPPTVLALPAPPPAVPLLPAPAPRSAPLALPAPVAPSAVVPALPHGRLVRPSPLFFARTQYAGAFLLLGHALQWLDTARNCLSDANGTLTRGFLTSVFALVVGLERIYHLDQMEDRGFAVLTGGRRCPSRYRVGEWRRHLPWYEVDAFCRRTSPWHLIRDEAALVSYDEHTIPRWTHKFHIGKGYITTRNKHMRCEKLFYTYDVLHDRYLAVRATPGNWGLNDLAVPLTRQTLERGRPEYLHALFDAGAGHSDANVRALWNLAEEYAPRLDVTLRASRYPHRVKRWQALPSNLFVAYEEPGPYVGAPAKEVALAETTTVLKDESPEQAVRTVIAREEVSGPKKDRWHSLFTTSVVEPDEVLFLYRRRQHHEQGYRVEVHDEFLDAVPPGYDKASTDPLRPRFQRGGMQMIGWLAALVYNATGDLGEAMAGDYRGSHVRTLRRMVFNRPGALYQTPQALIVALDPFAGQESLIPVIDEFNAHEYRLPWLENRRVVVSLTTLPKARAGP